MWSPFAAAIVIVRYLLCGLCCSWWLCCGGEGDERIWLLDGEIPVDGEMTRELVERNVSASIGGAATEWEGSRGGGGDGTESSGEEDFGPCREHGVPSAGGCRGRRRRQTVVADFVNME